MKSLGVVWNNRESNTACISQTTRGLVGDRIKQAERQQQAKIDQLRILHLKR
jgi:hypothetical protein